MPPWNPRDDGALCDECPLGPNGLFREGPWRPVRQEDHRDDGATFVVVGDAPDKDDEQEGRPFSHSLGGTLMRAFRSARLSRPQASYTNAIACRLPGKASGAQRLLSDKIKRENKRREKASELPLKHPIECCRPRLERDLAPYRNILTLGKVATQGLTGISRGIAKVRGSPWGVDSAWRKVPYDADNAVRMLLPTFHPRYIQRAPNRFHVWVADVRKALRLFTGTLEWEDPVITEKPTPQQLIDWFLECKPTRYSDGTMGPIEICDDVETTRHPQGMRATMVTLRTLSFARWKDGIEDGTVECMAIPILSTDGHTRFYPPAVERDIKRVVAWALLNPNFVKIGHNAGQFDRLVYEEWLKDVAPEFVK